jgi:hypothetical protein
MLAAGLGIAAAVSLDNVEVKGNSCGAKVTFALLFYLSFGQSRDSTASPPTS